MDILIDGVPLPADIKTPDARQTLAAHEAPWLGLWIGAWGNQIKHLMVVESVAADGTVAAVYAVGAFPETGITPSWSRCSGKVDGKTLAIAGKVQAARYAHTPSGRLNDVYGDGMIHAIMDRQSLETITAPDVRVPWTRGMYQMVETDLREDNKPVRLEVVLFSPEGDGPFPLAIINHGSTGQGDDPALFGNTWVDSGIAEFLNERGWLVAFPQRRGRGKSDGLYDEGFAENRSEGYTGETVPSLIGAERGLIDIEAVIAALRKRPDVDAGPVLMAGQSRGGALTITYAGRHPAQVCGAINFVGGWISDACKNASAINNTLFSQGGKYDRPALWLYGQGDYFYSMDHCRENFDAFRNAGGKGEFMEFTVNGQNNGHHVLAYPPLWQKPVARYLDSLADFEAGDDTG